MLEFTYLVSTRMGGKSYRKRLRSLLLSSLTQVFVIVVSVLINSFEYWSSNLDAVYQTLSWIASCALSTKTKYLPTDRRQVYVLVTWAVPYRCYNKSEGSRGKLQAPLEHRLQELLDHHYSNLFNNIRHSRLQDRLDITVLADCAWSIKLLLLPASRKNFKSKPVAKC